MIMAERIARVLTEHYLEENEVGGSFGETSVDRLVDQHWRAHLPLARDLLRAIRQPDPTVSCALAETGAWEDAIDGAIEDSGMREEFEPA